MEKVWSRISLVHNIFFLSYSMFACAMYWFFVITFFFNFHIIILVDRTCWLSRRNHLYIPRSHPTECVYCSAQSFCFFGKAKFSFYKFQLEGGNAVIFHTSWKWPENKTNRVRRHLGDKMFSTVAKSVSGSQCLCSTKFVFLSQEHTDIHNTHKHDFLHKK